MMQEFLMLLFGVWLPLFCLAACVILLIVGLCLRRNRTERKKILRWAGVFAVLAFLPAIVLTLAALLGIGAVPE